MFVILDDHVGNHVDVVDHVLRMMYCSLSLFENIKHNFHEQEVNRLNKIK
jgi:hypothetical protein